MNPDDPNDIMRDVIKACADCDTCRFLMDQSCLLFPELYRLYDREKEEGKTPGESDLARLEQLCTLCGLCPCANIRGEIIRAKAARVAKYGMPMAVRLLADVQRFARKGSRFAALINNFMRFGPAARMAKKIAGIDPRRELPSLSPESFFDWAERNHLGEKQEKSPKAAYFAGCTAVYFFPEVAKSAVVVLQHNHVAVFVPPQQCCGMPTLVEGDAHTTLTRTRFNVAVLRDLLAQGYDLVCSCPTCGFYIKVLLKDKAVYAPAYQKHLGAGADEIRIPEVGAGDAAYKSVKKSMYDQILKDDGLFSGIDPLSRMRIANHTRDMGEYLQHLLDQNRLSTELNPVPGKMVYFAPCHQREQRIKSPYEALMALIPGLNVKRIGGEMDCCGMGGSLGFKESFHDASTTLGKPLMAKIEAAAPEAIITDCLSCRLQFHHMLPAIPVYHPLEILKMSYEGRRQSFF
jgi:glycerol-3-phosphate dehydrogenase subunit C